MWLRIVNLKVKAKVKHKRFKIPRFEFTILEAENEFDYFINQYCVTIQCIQLSDTYKNKHISYINPSQLKVFGVIFSVREIRRIFPIKLHNFQLWKMPKSLNFRFPDG